VTRKRKLVYAAIATLAALACFEGIARLATPPPPSRPPRTIPAFREFLNQAHLPTFVRATRGGRTLYERNPSLPIPRCGRARPFLADKPPDARRLFCLGASTVFGDKLPEVEAFPSLLGAKLADRAKDVRFEVINLGQNGAAVSDLLLLAREVVRYDPDLLLVYAGHNEFQRYLQEMIETGPQSWSGSGGRWIIEHSACARLFRSLFSGGDVSRPSRPQRRLYSTSSVGSHLAAVAKDHRRIEDRFRRSVRGMIDLARAEGVRIAFCTVVSNLAGVEPLKSMHLVPLGRREEMEFDLCYVVGKLDLQFARRVSGERWRDEVTGALAYLDRAIEIDSTHADARYRRAKCLAALGRHVEARREFEAARDLDMATGRARGYINRALGEECAKRGVAVIDLIPVFESAARDGTMGDDLFIDEVHPNRRGHQIIAATIAQSLPLALGLEK